MYKCQQRVGLSGFWVEMNEGFGEGGRITGVGFLLTQDTFSSAELDQKLLPLP